MRGAAVALAVILATALSGCLLLKDRDPPAPVAAGYGSEPVLTGIKFPASFAFAPDGRLFYAERLTGDIRVAAPNGSGGWEPLPEPVANLTITLHGETGLLGIALHPDFAREPWLYAFYVDGPKSDMTAHVHRFRIEGNQSVAREPVVEPLPGDFYHTGGILEFGPDGNLYVSVGDAGLKPYAQVPWTTPGKILRVTPTGERPADNPWPWSYAYSVGHRNVFGLAFDPETGALWATENGPNMDDEVNRIRAGGNYGWPLAVGATPLPGFEEPAFVFGEPVAPTEATFYNGSAHPGWRGDLFFGGWNAGGLHHMEVHGSEVSNHTLLLNNTGGTLDVEVGPDGHLYYANPLGIHRVVRAPASK